MITYFFATCTNLSHMHMQFIRDEFLILFEREENILTLLHATAAKQLRTVY